MQSAPDDHHRFQHHPLDLQIRSGRPRLARRRRHAVISVFRIFEHSVRTPAARRARFAAFVSPSAPLHGYQRRGWRSPLRRHVNSASGRIPDRQRPFPASNATRRPPGDLPNTPKPPPENQKNEGFQIGSRPNRRRKIASTTSAFQYARRACATQAGLEGLAASIDCYSSQGSVEAPTGAPTGDLDEAAEPKLAVNCT